MITKKDIEQFFDLEAEASKKRWGATMKLPINDRVRKRKAIKSVYLDKEFSGQSEENYRLLKVSFNINLADFKEGECLILHRENTTAGISCRLNKFEGDDTIILEVFPPDMPASLESYYDQPLVLDKDKVDLRNKVYLPFICQLPNSSDRFWSDMILNSRNNPTFENQEGCENKLKETENSFGLELLPKQREAIKNSMMAKDYYLIQGPPGTGKSFVLGIIMLEEIFDLKHNVIVIGPNHMAINNALTQILKLMPSYSILYTKVGQFYNAPKMKVTVENEEHQITNVARLNVSWATRLNSEHNLNWIIGLTPHALYTSRARGLKCDTLIITDDNTIGINGND